MRRARRRSALAACGLRADSTSIGKPPLSSLEPAMSHRIVFHRSLSLAVAALLTLGMLGGIDQLSQREDGPRQWAQTEPVRA